MAFKSARTRQSLRQTMADNQRAMDGIARMMGKPTVSLGPIPEAPKPRGKVTMSGVIPEGVVQKSIIDLLVRHPMVGMVERINSGTMQSENEAGEKRYTEFNHVYGRASNGLFMAASDVSCTLRGGHWAGKRLVIEVKNSAWTHVRPGNQRENEQSAYLATVRECGGYGIFASSVEQVIRELDRIRAS